MKKFSYILLFILLSSCDSTIIDDNPILPNVQVNKILNLNLPLYQNLQFNNGSAFIENEGVKGIIVFRFSNTNILAWDAACPHITPSQCSKMRINGVKMVCDCDATEFSILNGSPLSGTQYPARQYRAVYNESSNNITISNF